MDQPSSVFVNEIGDEKACIQHIKNKLDEQREGHSVVYTDDQVEFHIENKGHIQCSIFSDVEAIKVKNEEIKAKTKEIGLLNASITALESRIAQISGKLREAQDRDVENQVTIASLGKDLNQALAQRVTYLGQYRSDFFGRVRQAVKSVPGIEIKDDRFVFGSELLFPTASAELNEVGQRELVNLSEVIRDTVDSLPNDVDWILRIDGHTDVRPIRSPIFGDNRELSMARAMSVLRALARAGIPSDRLLATGFGSTRPVAIGNSEESLTRNRRIEIKLTTP